MSVIHYKTKDKSYEAFRKLDMEAILGKYYDNTIDLF